MVTYDKDGGKSCMVLSNGYRPGVLDIPEVSYHARSILEFDPDLLEHGIYTGFLARKIGEYIGMSGKELDDLEITGILHDIGKIVIPKGILDKPGKLDIKEASMIKDHARIGYRMLDGFPKNIRWGVAGHHDHKRIKPYRSKGPDRRRVPRDHDRRQKPGPDMLPEYAEIIAAADNVHTQIDESRPFRRAVSRVDAFRKTKRTTTISDKYIEPLRKVA